MKSVVITLMINKKQQTSLLAASNLGWRLENTDCAFSDSAPTAHHRLLLLGVVTVHSLFVGSLDDFCATLYRRFLESRPRPQLP